MEWKIDIECEEGDVTKNAIVIEMPKKVVKEIRKPKYA